MGRLIDADNLQFNGRNYNKSQMKAILDFIDSQPTAYDPDKVVEQLEKLKKAEQDRPDDCDEDGCGDGEQIYDDGRSQGRYEAFGKAIQIVRSGGIIVDKKTEEKQEDK